MNVYEYSQFVSVAFLPNHDTFSVGDTVEAAFAARGGKVGVAYEPVNGVDAVLLFQTTAEDATTPSAGTLDEFLKFAVANNIPLSAQVYFGSTRESAATGARSRAATVYDYDNGESGALVFFQCHAGLKTSCDTTETCAEVAVEAPAEEVVAEAAVATEEVAVAATESTPDAAPTATA